MAPDPATTWAYGPPVSAFLLIAYLVMLRPIVPAAAAAFVARLRGRGGVR